MATGKQTHSSAQRENSAKRKGRRKRLPMAPNLEAPPQEFEASRDDWQRMETAYGVELTGDQRAEITAIINHYSWWEPAESATAYVVDSIDWLKKLRASLARVWQDMSAASDDDAALFVKMESIRHLRSQRTEKSWT